MTDTLRHATMLVEATVKAANAAGPAVEGEALTMQLVACALGKASKYAASDRFGPADEMTLAFIEYATTLAAPIGQRLDDAAAASL